MHRELDLNLQVDRTAPRDARREVAALAAGLPDTLRQDLQLLVSELVANSLRHGALGTDDWIALRACIGDRSVHVEVSDPGQGFASLGGSEQPKSGLWILNQLADRWGIVRDDITRVWFETDLARDDLGTSRFLNELTGWESEDQDLALDLFRRYGPPDRVEHGSLVWRRGEAELALRSAPAYVDGLELPPAG